MVKNVLLILAILAAGLSVQAQTTHRLTGRIVNRNNEPVPYVTVHILNSSYNTVTDSAGNFSLQKLAGERFLIQFTRVGFEEKVQEINVTGNETSLNITLDPSVKELARVVVSADKRETVFKNLPVAVSVFNSRQLQEFRVWNVNELSSVVPSFYASEPGDKRNVSSLRGITTTSYDPAIATYIDGVNQFTLDMYIPQLFDVDRVEVLHGPQGTMYGRNAMGGVLNITTRQPTNHVSGFAEISAGNYGLQRYTAAIRTPVIKDKLFIGAAGLYEGYHGYYKNDFNNSDFDKQHSIIGNYYLKYLPAANWSLTLNAKHADNRNNGPFTLAYYDDQFKPFHVNQNALTTMVDKTFNTSLTLNHTNSHFALTAQTAYQSNYRYYKQPIDADFSPIDAVSLINNYGRSWNHVNALTEEIRISSPAAIRRLQWTAGTFLFLQSSPNKQATRFGNDATMIGLTDSNFSTINSAKANGKGIALFAQGTYTLSSRFDITAGLRYDHEYKKQSILGEYQHDPNPDPVFAYRTDTSGTATFNALSPKVSLLYKANEQNSVYASYSRGFRAGGLTPLSSDPSQPALYVYKPEYSNNFEAGYRTGFLDKKAQLNFVLFYSTVNKAQLPTLVLPDAVTIIKNVGTLYSKGLQADIDLAPVKGLEIMYQFGYTNASYHNTSISVNGAEQKIDGKKQIFTPDITSMLMAQYSYTLNEKKDIRVLLRGELKSFGRIYFDLLNTLSQSPYSLVNLRAGITNNKLGAYIWCRNLLNKKYLSYAYDFGAAHNGDPMTIGATVNVSLR